MGIKDEKESDGNNIMVSHIDNNNSCSKNVESNSTENLETSSESNEAAVNENKGGYVEEIIKISDDFNYIFDITKLENGDLILAGSDNASNNKVFVSSDNGVSWSEREIAHLTFEEDIRYTSLNLLKSGNILIAYVFVDGVNEEVKYAMANENGEVNAIELGVKQEISSEGVNNAPIYFTSLNNGDFIYRAMDTNEMVQIDGKSLQENFRYEGDMFFNMAINLGDKLIITSMDTTNEYDMNTGELIKKLNMK